MCDLSSTMCDLSSTMCDLLHSEQWDGAVTAVRPYVMSRRALRAAAPVCRDVLCFLRSNLCVAQALLTVTNAWPQPVPYPDHLSPSPGRRATASPPILTSTWGRLTPPAGWRTCSRACTWTSTPRISPWSSSRTTPRSASSATCRSTFNSLRAAPSRYRGSGFRGILQGMGGRGVEGYFKARGRGQG